MKLAMVPNILLGRAFNRLEAWRLFKVAPLRHIQRISITLLTAAALLNLCFLLDGGVLAKGSPNVILIIIDTLRADHLGCYGYSRNTSPYIDEFSREAVFFKNAISPAPWTTPAVASIFTGQYPHVMGYEDEAVILDNRFLCLAEIFRNNGYTTKGIIAHVFISQQLGFDQGFHSYDEDNAKGHGHVSSPSITEKALSFVEEHKDEAFFLFAHYFDPHCDYILHESYNYYPDYDGPLYSGQPIADLRDMAPDMTAKDIAYLNALYDSEIRFTDEHVGMLLGRLKELELYDDALIVITSDHGEGFLERGDYWIGHTKSVYQELIHVPLMIKLPGQTKGRTIEGYVSLMDLMPTIVRYAGFDIPDGYEYDGEPLELTGGKGPTEKAIFSETGRWATFQSVIHDGWKLICNPTEKEARLFNLAEDPGEMNDVSKVNEKKFRTLETMLHQWDYDMRRGRWKFKTRHPKLTREQLQHLKSLGYIR